MPFFQIYRCDPQTATLKRINKLQAEKGRADRLRRLARRNRDVVRLLDEHQRLVTARTKKPKSAEAS
jgi:hypothetical protein